MKSHTALLLAGRAAFNLVHAQEPVVAAADPEALFTDADPVHHANKQVVLHVLRELLQCNYWDQADRWLTEPYLHSAWSTRPAQARREIHVNLVRPVPNRRRPRRRALGHGDAGSHDDDVDAASR
jgi:hypothetical protein